jgi:hypothetical protein
MPITQDDRTDQDKQDLTILVIGTDRFLSHWGHAEGGTSIAAWACTPDTVNPVERWVRNRGDMKRVRIADARTYRPPQTCAHFHIYPVREGHASLR